MAADGAIRQYVCIMNNLALYGQLVQSSALLHQLQQESCLAGFCQALREFWLQPQISDDEILAILSAGNKKPVEPDFELFCEFWSPALYDPARKQLSWHPAEDKPESSFYVEHIGRLKGQLVAALIQPKTLLAVSPEFGSVTSAAAGALPCWVLSGAEGILAATPDIG